MKDTSFKISPSQRARLASVHQRGEDGALAPIEFALPEEPEFLMGGGGLYGTARRLPGLHADDHAGRQREGRAGPAPETVDLMAQNHIGALEIGRAQDRGADAVQRRRAVPGDVGRGGG